MTTMASTTAAKAPKYTNRKIFSPKSEPFKKTKKIAKVKKTVGIDPIIMPAIANPRPLSVPLLFLICSSAIIPRINPTIPGAKVRMPQMPKTIDAIASLEVFGSYLCALLYVWIPGPLCKFLSHSAQTIFLLKI
jgi:hypothetical protein